MNDRIRRQWVLNHAKLFALWRRSGIHPRAFVERYRETLDEIIDELAHSTGRFYRERVKIGD